MKQFLPLGFLLLLLAGCSKSTVPSPTDAEKGSIRFDCSISAQVATVQEGGTKADPATRELPASCIPDISQMKLHLTGSTTATEYHYENMAAYDQPLLDPDDYTAHFTYGDSEAEGPQAAYFEGTTTCTVAARKTVTQSVTHSLSNSLYTLEFADWFKKYYTSCQIQITTSSGYQSTHTITSETESVPIFVKPNSTLYISGTAVKTNGVEVTFPKTEIGTTAARTWHTIVVDAGSAGQANITVDFDDTPTSIEEIDIELNPEA